MIDEAEMEPKPSRNTKITARINYYGYTNAGDRRNCHGEIKKLNPDAKIIMCSAIGQRGMMDEATGRCGGFYSKTF